jgi:hypothetical protein
VHVFHAGTAEKDGKVVTSGGRVLCVTALGDKVKIAAERAYEIAEKIRFDGDAVPARHRSSGLRTAMNAPRGVIFDLYHTLTPRESEWSSRPATCDMLGIDRRAWDRVLIETSRWRLAGEERDPYRILRRLVDQVDRVNPGRQGARCPSRSVPSASRLFSQHSRRQCRALAEAEGRGVKLALLSKRT